MNLRVLWALTVFTLLANCAPERRPAVEIVTSTGSDRPFRVGLLTPGSVNDGGWNAIAFEGLKRIEAELGAQISHQETKTPAEFEEGFRYFGVNRFSLAFGHGFEFQDAAMAAGRQFPDTVFITTSGKSVGPNVSPMVFELEQATYLLGVIAAMESRTGKAGLVGGIKLPSIDSTFIAFKAGAQSVNPAFEVREIYLGNFDDLAAARVAALTLIDAGADHLFHQANEAGRGVFQACTERKTRCFGANRDQNNLAPDVIVASAVLNVPEAFVQIATQVRDKTFKPGIQRFGMKPGIVSIVWNPKLKRTVKPGTFEAVTRIEKDIREGHLKVPRGNF